MTTTTPISTTLTLPLMAAILGLVVAGCSASSPDAGAESTDSGSVQSQGSDESPSEGDGDASGGGAADLGTITVATTSYTVLEVINCEPVQTSDLVTELFDVIALGQSSGGDDVLFFAYTQEQSGARANFVDYQGPEGTWSSPGGNATFTLDGGVLSGASSIVNTEETETVTIQFTFEVPDELVDCD